MTWAEKYGHMDAIVGRRVIRQDCGGEIDVRTVESIWDRDGWAPPVYMFDPDPPGDWCEEDGLLVCLLDDADEDAAMAQVCDCYDRMWTTTEVTA